MKNTFFAPGRTELAGNHTDHQRGRILAAGIDVGITAVCEKNNDNIIRVKSQGYDAIEVDLKKLDVRPEEFGSSAGLVRGVAAAMKDLCVDIGGFNAEVSSTIQAGSGLSSSAAYAVLMGKILNYYYNNNELEPIVLARVAQTAENSHFGKPCGLMDQLASALGQTIYVDFSTMDIQEINADFSDMGLQLCLTDTGGSHAGLETSYARIPADMNYVATCFGKTVLSEIDPDEFRTQNWDLKSRHVRRAKHFFDENERVPLMRDALMKKDAQTYMRLMNESGRSSEKYLNNIVTSTTGDTKLQEGLELSAKLLNGKGAWRVHGGGFAGCVQALMPIEYFIEYKKIMEEKFGIGKCREINLGK